MRHKLTAAVVLLLFIPLGACERGGERIAQSELRSLVLQPSDLGPGYVQFDFGPQAFTDYRPGPRFEPARFGREGGWRARYRRSDRSATTGPLVIESRVDLFLEEEGAQRDLDAYVEEFDRSLRAAGAERISVPRIGDAAVAMTLLQSQGSTSIRFYRIAWREQNVTAFIELSGFERSLPVTNAIRLAQQQQRRIADAVPQ